MTQNERQERSKREILKAATEEFGAHGYEKVTMDSICSKHGISKGMMYHYYSNKDELFLLCVEEMFRFLAGYVEERFDELEGIPAFEAIQKFFLLREYFFMQHPEWRQIFENAMIRPPRQMEQEIYVLRRPVRELNQRFLKQIISGMPLRPELNEENVARYLEGIEYVLSGMMEQYSSQGKNADVHSVLEETVEVLDMILFGIVQKEK